MRYIHVYRLERGCGYSGYRFSRVVQLSGTTNRTLTRSNVRLRVVVVTPSCIKSPFLDLISDEMTGYRKGGVTIEHDSKSISNASFLTFELYSEERLCYTVVRNRPLRWDRLRSNTRTLRSNCAWLRLLFPAVPSPSPSPPRSRSYASL